ncbi:DEAD/DEAH box helicase, partial [Pseudactinotalea sp.]|uniref:DEAD/DEAH box helicase n=1 Tax=Pseudactinotalea sp. TaxID=1926260 RepID=UPI003B3A2814
DFCDVHGSDRGCSHTLAVQLALGAREAAPTAPWQRALDEIVRPTAEQQPVGELALFMTIVNPTRMRDRWSYGPRLEPFLGIRPARRGQRGTWIKGNVEWHGLHRGMAEPHVVGLLSELAGLHDVATDTPYAATPEWLSLARIPSRGLWEILTELRDAGVEMVSPGKAQRPVLITDTAARARVAIDEQQGHLRVRGQLLVEGEITDTAAMYAVGSPAVAVAQVRDHGRATEQAVLIRLEAPVPDALWQLLRADEPPVVDSESRELFEQTYLPRLRELAPIESPDHSYTVPPERQTTLELEVRASEGQVHQTWSWADQPSRRDRAREREILARVSDAVGGHEDLVGMPLSGIDRPADRTLTGTAGVLFVGEVLPRLRGLDGVRVNEAEGVPSHSRTVSGPRVSIAAEPGANDWFDLSVEVEVDGEAVPFGQLFVTLARGEPIFVLPDGRYFSLLGEEFDQLRAIIEEARALSDRPVESLRISRYQVDLWAELLELGIVHAQEQEWLRAARGLGESVTLEPVPVPSGVTAELRHYQQTGLAWLHFLRTNRLGGILADDMGLGKTLQAIAMMEVAREEDPAMPPFLVVAPTSVVGNWVRECERFAPGLRVVAIDATERKRGTPLAESVAGAHVVVTSYTLLRLEEEAYAGLACSGAIFDEAQMIKNHRARGYRSARLVQAPFKLAITGTPLENNLTELWALSALVCPGLLGGEKQFADLYRAPIEKDRDSERLARLQRRLRPFVLRRRKEEVATELPPKQEQVRELELHPKHRRLYELRLQRERQKVLGLLDDMESHRFQVFR